MDPKNFYVRVMTVGANMNVKNCNCNCGPSGNKETAKIKNFDNIEACEDHFYISLTGHRGRQRGYAPLSEFDQEAARVKISPKEDSIEGILERRLPLPPRSHHHCHACGKVVIITDDSGKCHSVQKPDKNPNDDIDSSADVDSSSESTGIADIADEENYTFEQELSIVKEEAENLLNDLGRTIAYCGFVIPDTFKVTIEKAVPTEEVFTTSSSSSNFLLTIYMGDARMMLTGDRFQIIRDLSLVVKGAALLLAANLAEEE